jgi:hypothetical protein
METVNALCATLEMERQALTSPQDQAGRSGSYNWVAIFALGTATGAALTWLLT